MSKSLRSTNCSPPGFSVHGIFQARILEWVAISYSRGSFQPRDGNCVSCISCTGMHILYYWAIWDCLAAAAAKSLQSCLTLCDPMDCSPQLLLSMGFSRQEHWSGLPFPTPGDLSNPGIEPESSAISSVQLLSRVRLFAIP